MSRLFFDSIPFDSIDRTSLDGGNVLVGRWGEGSAERAPGVRIKTSGVGPNEYRVLRPRLPLSCQDGYDIKSQVRFLNTITTTAEFQGIGLQCRAFSTAGGSVSEVYRNAIDENPALWNREKDFLTWKFLTSHDTMQNGSEFFIPEVVVMGQDGYADVTSVTANTTFEQLTAYFNAGPDIRQTSSQVGVYDIGPIIPRKVYPGQNIIISHSQELQSSVGLWGVYLDIKLRRENGDKLEKVISSPFAGAFNAGDVSTVDVLKNINATEEYNQIRFQIRYIRRSGNSNAIFSNSNMQTDFHLRDILRTGS